MAIAVCCFLLTLALGGNPPLPDDPLEKVAAQVEEIRGRSLKAPVAAVPFAAEPVKAAPVPDGAVIPPERPSARTRAFRTLGLLPEKAPDPGKVDRALPCSWEGRDFFFHEEEIHRTVHALQHQYHPDSVLWRALEREDQDDARLAAAALVEGEAQLVLNLHRAKYAQVWARAAAEQGGPLSMVTPLSRKLADQGLCHFLVETRSFPITAGERFLRRIHDPWGWPEVDRLFSRLPRSTEQILHPEKYLAENDPPIRIRLPALPLAPGWEGIFENTLGELGVSCWVRETGDAIRALRVAPGWGGDRYRVYTHQETGATAFYLASVWDSGKDAWQFFNAMEKSLAYLLKAKATSESEQQKKEIFIAGSEGAALLMHRDDSVLILKGFSADRAALQALSAAAWEFTTML